MVMKKSALNFRIGRVAQKLLFLAGFMLVANVVLGAPFSMPEQDCNWDDAWGTIPTSSDNVTVDKNGYTLTINIDAECNNFTLSNGTVTVPAGKTLTINGALNISSYPTLNVDGTVVVNNISNSSRNPKITGSGTITINGGEFKCNLDDFTGTLIIDNMDRQLCGSFNLITTNYTATSSIPGGTYTNLTIEGTGTIELCGDVIVTGSLTWDSNNRIRMRDHSFTIESSAIITSAVPFGSSHGFSFESQTTHGFVTIKGDVTRLNGGTIPIGVVNTNYRPVTIDASTTAASSFSVRPTNGVSAKGIETDLQCYWTTLSENISDAQLTFEHLPADEPTGSPDLQPFCNSGSGWKKWDDGSYTKADKTITFNHCTPSGKWSACEDITTYYSFTSGNWEDATSWTFDPAGIDRTGANIPTTKPSEGSRVVIKNPDIITVTEGGIILKSLTINDGGVLDLRETTGHNLGTVKGQGTLKLASAEFPGGTFTTFVRSGGGTVEYNNADNFNLPNRETYNNLVINIADNAVATLAKDLKTNGNFIINNGTFQIGNSGTGRTIIVCGNLTVERKGEIVTRNGDVTSTGSSVTYNNGSFNGHKLELQGDFINNGKVSFTQLDAPDYASTSSRVTNVFFTKTTGDQNVVINGVTKFHTIRVQKGIDKTHVLNIEAAELNQFFLLGPRTGWHYNGSEDKTSDYYLALAIEAGTVRLGQNITIDALMTGNNNGYKIDESACLWIDGANVAVGKNNSFALYIHGDLRVTNGTLDVTDPSQGIVFRTTANITLDKGHIVSSLLRTSQANGGGGTHVGSLTINGGIFELRGNNSDKKNYPTLGLTFPAGGFNMSGGDLIINRGTNSNNAYYGLVLGTNIDNCSITGGTIHLLCQNWNGAADLYINSTVPLWNLEIVAASTSNKVQIKGFNSNTSNCATVAVQPLVVLNNLTIKSNGTLVANNENVYVGGNFTIENTGTYTPGNNTTYFNGSATQNFTIGGTISNNLNNLTLAENAQLNLQNDAIMRGTLTLEQGSVFYDQQHTLTVRGNIVSNSGTHYNSASSTGCILLDGNGNQTIGGDGHGSFNNLHISKNGGTVTATADMAVTGNLRLLSDYNLNIGTYNLNLCDADAAIYSNATTGINDFSASRMIQTAGHSSDGGITRLFSTTDNYLFPFGFDGNYLPANIAVDVEPTTYGSVTSRPVNGKHYVFGDADVLKCYWHNTSSGFDGVTSVNHTYKYEQTFVGTAEATYIPAYYKAGIWYYNDNTSLVFQNDDRFEWESCSTIDGDFTCGVLNAFTQTPIRLYSVGDGLWNNSTTWVDDFGNPGVPYSNTIVIIGDNHKITAQNNAFCGSLTIAEDAKLDLGTNVNQRHNLGVLTKNDDGDVMGTIIIRTNRFPDGDFGEFLSAGGGTIEYNASENNITIPTTVTTYNNLRLQASTRFSVTMPNTNVEIFGNLTSNGDDNTHFNSFNSVNNSRTVTVDGNLDVKTGILSFSGNSAQNLIVRGNIMVNNNASFDTRGNRTNQLTIYGNMDVDGTLNFVNGNSRVATTFTGTANDTIKGTGDITLYTLTCDKGTDATPVLSIERNIDATPQDGVFLNLLNGTFRADGDVDIKITTNHNFEIRSSACLSTKSGTFSVCNTNNQQYNVVLHGKIEVLGGSMLIGNGNYGNDIEYSSAQAQIDVQGGLLSVGGQIRRPYTMTPVNLHYSQSGGDVIIFGKNRDQSASMHRAVIDICNEGSFTMSSGTLTIAGGSLNDANQADILLAPATSSATGGVLAIGNSTTASNQTFYMSASAELGNVEIGTDASPQTLKLVTNHVDINGSLKIKNGSVFDANGYNSNIAGDLECHTSAGFVAGTDEQIVTFDGNAVQNIKGGGNNINFAKLTINNPTTVQLSNITANCNGLLTISRGAFDDAGNHINTYASVLNDSRHISSEAGGGLFFVGDGIHKMMSSSGKSGTYGNLIIDNQTDMENPISVTGLITLNDDIYANDYRLSLMADASFAEASTGMIILNGAIGDAGVRKYFANGFSGEFLYRIGIPGQYTPVKYNFTSAVTSADGYINIRLMNNLHANRTQMPTTYLSYYWAASSEGLSDYAVTHEYYYTDDLLTLGAGDAETGMVPQRYYDAVWEHYSTEGSVDADANKFVIDGIDVVDGEFTAGFPAYSQLPPYFSRVENGRWVDASSWFYYENGQDVTATLPPSGNPLTICSGHTITIDGNEPQCAYSVDIQTGATLDAGSTIGHNFGIVMGGGTLKLGEISGGGVYSFMVPAGKYDDFFSTATSTIEFNGSNSAVLPAKPGNYDNPFPNIRLSGGGTKNITASALFVRGNITIENGNKLNNSTYNRDFYLGGDYIDLNDIECGYICGTSKVIFVGTQMQKIDIKTDANFYNVQINNAQGVDVTNGGTANNNVVVANNLTLTNGNFLTNSNALICLTSTNQNVISGGGANSFVDGPLTKKISSGGSFNFPVGNGDRYGNVTLSNVNMTADWTAQYCNNNPSGKYPTERENFDALTLTSISDNEYWIVTRPTGGKAKVGLRWDDQSCDMFNTYPLIQQRLKMVEFDGTSMWNVCEVTASGNATAGMLTTNAVVEEDNYIFTFGLAGVIAAITTTELKQICNNGEDAATINVSLSGTAPFSLTYSVNGTSHTQSGIGTSPYQIVLNSSQLGNTVGTYSVKLEAVSDASEVGTIRPGNGKIEVLTAYTPTFTDEGGVDVAGTGETRTYEVESHNNESSFMWRWEGDGPTIDNPYANPISVTYGSNNNAAKTYYLVVTETTTATGCAISNTLAITVSRTPQPSFIYEPYVCEDESKTYTTANNGGHHYTWTVDGQQKGTENSLEIDWSEYSAGDHIVKVEERNGTGRRPPTGEYQKTITVFAKPNSAEILPIDPICSGTATTVTLGPTESNVTYKLYRRGNKTALNTFSGHDGENRHFTTPTITAVGNIEFYAVATNPGCSVLIPEVTPPSSTDTSFVTLVVNETPNVTLNWPILYAGVESEVTLDDVVGAPLTTYNIDFTDGTNNEGFVSEGIKVTATGNIAGTITISNANCSTDIPFSELMADGYVWSGKVSSEWENTGNWYSRAIPTSEHDAIIRTASRLPIISGNAEAKSVKIESGELTISGSNTLNVYGDWANSVGNAGFTAGQSTVAFKNNAVISGSTAFNTISNESGNTLTISSDGYVTVNGNVENAGTLTGGAGSTLEMAGTNDAVLAAGTYNLANLKINKTAGSVAANSEIKVDGEFAIFGGILSMNNHTLVLGSNATTSYDNNNTTAYVDGEMSKTGTAPIVFPIGNNNRRAMVGIKPNNANASTRFTAGYTYVPKDPNAEPTAPDPMDAEMVRVSKMDNWQISGSNGASAYVTLYWDDGDISEITKLEYLTIAHWNGSKWEMLPATATGNPKTGQIRTSAPVSSFSPFTFGSTEVTENPLPVEISDFTGRQDGNIIVLEWTTLSEKDNDFFEIERSTDGINFATIGFVQGAGNSAEKLAYNFADNAPESGRAYYRLSQVDYDGTRSYADRLVSVVYAADRDIRLTIVPNPTRGLFNVLVKGASEGVAKLLSQSGKPIRIVEIHLSDELIDISDLPNGIYILQYQTGDNVVHERVVKL